jgi:hypothetical protein
VFKPPNELAWDARVEELLRYKAEHGDTDVPNTYEGNQSLARWVGDQRRAHKRGAMARHRVDRLDEIGFLWSKAVKSPWEVKWDGRFDELQRFQYKYGQIGTTLNGCVHPQWHALSEWATHQRKRYKEGKLRKDLVDRLGESSSDAAAGYWRARLYPPHAALSCFCVSLPSLSHTRCCVSRFSLSTDRLC